jgi:hypothetical protein
MNLPTEKDPSGEPILSWAGKAEAQRALEAPFQGTLLPVEPYGVGAPHIFIQGESLEVLKMLRNSYEAEVRMIWADLPSLLRNDYIYPDDPQDPLKAYWQLVKKPGQGIPLQDPGQAFDRRLERWLSMLYPRLSIARDLQQDDGMIFVCVDPLGLPYLRNLMDNLFGIDRYLGTIVWQKAPPAVEELPPAWTPPVSPLPPASIDTSLEFILAYSGESGEKLIPQTVWTWDETGDLQVARQELLAHVPLANPANLSAAIKPTRLIRRLLEMATPPHQSDYYFNIVLDLFGGYGTAAQAVVEQNLADGGQRRAIQISLPQPLLEPEGEYHTFSDVAQARFQQVTRQARAQSSRLERDFQAFELVASNFENWRDEGHYEEEAFDSALAEAEAPGGYPHTLLAAGWTYGGVLYELILRYGFGLDFETEPYSDFEENQILLVIDSHGASTFILCLDDEIPLEVVRQLHLDEDDRFVCRREALDDETAALLSESCRVKFI